MIAIMLMARVTPRRREARIGRLGYVRFWETFRLRSTSEIGAKLPSKGRQNAGNSQTWARGPHRHVVQPQRTRIQATRRRRQTQAGQQGVVPRRQHVHRRHQLLLLRVQHLNQGALLTRPDEGGLLFQQDRVHPNILQRRHVHHHGARGGKVASVQPACDQCTIDRGRDACPSAPQGSDC